MSVKICTHTSRKNVSEMFLSKECQYALTFGDVKNILVAVFGVQSLDQQK